MTSAACLVTSVPVTPIATPTSASFTAGASFTPSPVMVTISPRRLKLLTILSLCTGSTLAKTVYLPISRSSSSSESLSSSAPVIAIPPLSSPAFAATAMAVFLWSPVIMTVFTEADAHLRIAVFASSRGGSVMPAKPRNTRFPRSGSSLSEVHTASARTLRALSDISPAFSSRPLRTAAVIAAGLPFSSIYCEHLGSITSSAPLK